MPKILITGANSFIGTSFKKYSVFRDTDVVSLIGKSAGEIDFRKYEVVLHLAAIVHQSKRISENEYFKINRDLCLQVAENAKRAGVRQFVFMSTLKVYGNNPGGNELRNENSLCFPDDSYGRSKYEAETGLKNLEGDDFKISIIRTPLVYGDGVKANMLNLVKLVDRVSILPFANTKNSRSFTYIENLVSFIDRIIELNRSGIFIAMDENALSTTELIILISKYLDKKVHLFPLPGVIIRLGSIVYPSIFDRLYNSLEVDNTQSKNVLNFSPPFSTEEGIKRMVISYKSRNV
jgi:nucleoside-diphosphate-sugar epimerase